MKQATDGQAWLLPSTGPVHAPLGCFGKIEVQAWVELVQALKSQSNIQKHYRPLELGTSL